MHLVQCSVLACGYGINQRNQNSVSITDDIPKGDSPVSTVKTLLKIIIDLLVENSKFPWNPRNTKAASLGNIHL